jgi:ketopantoate reductase
VIPEGEEQRVLDSINSLPPTIQPSLLLDLQAEASTEVAVLSGAIARFSEENRLETPIHGLAAIALAHHGTLESK